VSGRNKIRWTFTCSEYDIVVRLAESDFNVQVRGPACYLNLNGTLSRTTNTADGCDHLGRDFARYEFQGGTVTGWSIAKNSAISEVDGGRVDTVSVYTPTYDAVSGYRIFDNAGELP
jgi:hypothetical protein